MNTLDFDLRHYEAEGYSFERKFDVVGPSGRDFWSWDGMSSVHEDAESEFGVTLDSGGEGTASGDYTLSFSSEEVENDEIAEKIVNFIVADVAKRTGWKVIPK